MRSCVSMRAGWRRGRLRRQAAAHCAAWLADYKVPETWVIQAEPLPRNANGKLMKRSLRPQKANAR